MSNTGKNTQDMTLVLGGTGKTGRRVVERLKARGVPVRVGSRSAERPFEWQDPTTWAPVLQDVAADFVDLLSYLFNEALDGRNAHLTDGVQRALGRAPRDFTDYVRDASAAGAWQQ